MRSFYRALRTLSVVTLFFFSWTFLPLWQVAAYAAEPQGAGSRKPQPAQRSGSGVQGPATSNERFGKALEAIRENVSRAGDKADKGDDDAKEREIIKTKRAEIESVDSEFKKEFAATEKKLKDAKLPKEILDRHYKFVKHYEDNLKELRTNLDDVEKAKTKADRKAKILKSKLHLEKTKAPRFHKPFDPSRLPNRTREIKPVQISWLDKIMDWLVPAAEAADLPPTASDLAETLETSQTQEIRDLAQRLGGTSVTLYEYVRNAYPYEPYAGSTKGALQTIKEKTGNEWDQASLLIALYRASGTPARYVVGTVEIPIDKAMNWLGVEDPQMAGTLLSTLGKSASLVITGGKITALRLQHVWVRAYVPFLSSRGATSGPGDMWVDVDPSFKGQTITKTLAANGLPTFDQAGYLSTFRTESPFEFYKTQLQTFLDANQPGYVPEALAPESEITPERFGILIGQPPYTIKSVIGTYSEVPDSYRQKFTLSITDPSTGDNLLYYSAPLPQLIGKRLTISYAPATNADEALVANYGGLYSTPAYLVNLKPQVKLNGLTIVDGNTSGFGTEQKLDFIFDTTIDTGRVENTIIVGGYYAIGLSTRYGGTRGSILERTNQLATVTGTIDLNDPATLDEKLGEILYLSGVVYHQNLDSLTKQIAAFNQVVDVRDVSEMMYFLAVKVDSVFGMSRKVTPVGITGDMDRDLHTVVPVDGDLNRIRSFMRLVGNVSSYFEHSITEKIYQAEAVSTVKAIQLAHDQGIPVHTVTSQNISTELPILQLSSDLKADIASAINAGQEVIVQERNMTLGTWSGAGYLIQDPTNGKGAYLINGGYGGVATVANALIEDLARAAMSEIGLSIASTAMRREVRFPGRDNLMNTLDDTIYHEILLTADGSELQEDSPCREQSTCSWKYGITHLDYGQPLVRISENGTNAYLTYHIRASDWQSQDGAPYMRAGTAILYAVEYMVGFFSKQRPDTINHNISPGGTGYRTHLRTQQLRESGNSRPSLTSNHMDGVAADVILKSVDLSVETPKKCEVLQEAAYIVQSNGEVLHENTASSVHLAVPGKTNFDYNKHSWSCQ